MVIVVIELIFVVYQYGSLANSTVSTVLFFWLESVRLTSDGFEIVIEVFLVPELSVYKFVSAVHKQLNYIEVVRWTISNSEIHIQLQIWYYYNLMNQNFNLFYVYPTFPGSWTTVTVQRKLTTLAISANMDTYVRQRGEPGQAQVPIPPLKQTNMSRLV